MSGKPIVVSRDLAGIRQAAAELFEEALLEEEQAAALRKLAEREAAGQQVANRDRLLESLQSARTLADGYYLWVDYLGSLDALVAAGYQIPLADLRASEVLGLQALRAAREAFAASHPQCPKCGAINRRGALACRRCGDTMKAKGGK